MGVDREKMMIEALQKKDQREKKTQGRSPAEQRQSRGRKTEQGGGNQSQPVLHLPTVCVKVVINTL